MFTGITEHVGRIDSLEHGPDGGHRKQYERGRKRREPEADDGGAHVHRRPDREIDAGNQHHEGHADGDNRHIGRLRQNIFRILKRQKPRRDRRKQNRHERQQYDRRCLQQPSARSVALARRQRSGRGRFWRKEEEQEAKGQERKGAHRAVGRGG